MAFESCDFEERGIAFTKENFPKESIFRLYNLDYKVTGDWVGDIVKVTCLKGDVVETFSKDSGHDYRKLREKKMTLNHEEIKKKIDAIPGICKDGKEGVTNLLKEFGYIPPVAKRMPVGGEIWVTKLGTYICIVQINRDSDNKIIPRYFGYMLVNSNQHSPGVAVGYDMFLEAKCDRLLFVAKNIKEFKSMEITTPIN